MVVAPSAMAVTSQPQLASAATPVSAKLGAGHSLLANWSGVNFDYNGAAPYASADASFYQQLATLKPGTLRYPGGTGANFFQWKAGLSVNPPAGSCVSSTTSGAFRFRLPDLVKAYRATKAPPVYDLNVMTSSLSCQLQLLRRARQLGLPVRYVELGNELYLGIKDYPSFFPTAADYGTTVARYVQAIRKDFPHAQVAAVGSLPTSTARERDWNTSMLDAARKAHGLPGAITLHVYPTDDKTLTASGLPGLFTEPYTELAKISAVIGQLPASPKVWLTEYNLLPMHTPNGNPAQTSYAQALFVAEMNLLLAQHVPSAQFADLWAAFGGNASYAYAGHPADPPQTPGGLALQLVDDASHGATQTRPMNFTGAPALTAGGAPGLIGQSFTSATARREVLINLTGQVLTIKTGSAIPAGRRYELVSFSGSPVAQVSQASALTVKHETTGSSITVPAYSIILVNPPG